MRQILCGVVQQGALSIIILVVRLDLVKAKVKTLTVVRRSWEMTLILLPLSLPVLLESRVSDIVIVDKLSQTLGGGRAACRNLVDFLTAAEKHVAFARPGSTHDAATERFGITPVAVFR